MIKKNINGGFLSGEYASTVERAPRKWSARIYADGSLLDCGIKKMTITKGSCGNMESFSVGNVFSNLLECELLGLSDSVKGKELEVQIGLDTGSWEWITMGHFVVIEAPKTVFSTDITAYGFSTTKTSGSFVIPSVLSLANIASAIEDATGCSVEFDADIDTSVVLAGGIDSGTSCYGGLQILAHSCGGYAVDTYDGNFAIHRFKVEGFATDNDGNITFDTLNATDLGDGVIVITADNTTFYTESSGNVSIYSNSANEFPVHTDRMVDLPSVEEEPFEITGVHVTATGQYEYRLTSDMAIDPDKTYYTRSGSGTSVDPYVYTEVEEPVVGDIGIYYEQYEIEYSYGSPIVLYDDNGNMSASAFDNYKKLVGYAYQTGTINLSLGDPRIEGDDVLLVYDVNGETYSVPCHTVIHSYDGGLSTLVQSVKATDESDGFVTNAPITQRLDDIGVAVSVAKMSAESARQYAEQAQESANQANDLLGQMEDAAEQAGTTLLQIYQDAEDAKDGAESAKKSAEMAGEYASRALGNLSTVQSVAETLTWITQHGTMTLTTDTAIDPTHVYFVRDNNGDYTVGSYRYSIVTEPNVANLSTYYELSIDESLNNYVGTHLALTGDGLWLLPASSGTNKVLIATGAGSTYTTGGTYIIDSGGNIVASFRADGATINGSGGAGIAHLGYGQAIGASGPTTAPYYTLGTRGQGDVGAYSFASGQGNIAKAYGAHAEGEGATAGGANSHAEGYGTKASGKGAHAEGWETEAGSDYSHAEGKDSKAGAQCAHAEGEHAWAYGENSHAQNYFTVAQRKSQTAIGEYNITESGSSSTRGNYALIIGNGDSSARSNAFAVTWDGNVHIDLAGYATPTTTDKRIYDALDSLVWLNEVTE